ncbi:hypothetical protein V4D30_01865 [Thermodesulfovibrio sp. 3907-1M]|uniref:Uncharacterized protein n=1 Tax=Thermodesulfovibrio autotrophicus TaxID=3118333 RepID=A0AAU8H0H6_9BACT
MDRRIIGVILGVAGIFLWFMPLVSWEERFFGNIVNLYQTGYHIGGIAYLLLVSLFSYAALSWLKMHQLRIVAAGVSLLICLIFLFQANANAGWGLIGLTILSISGIFLSVKDLQKERKSNKV